MNGWRRMLRAGLVLESRRRTLLYLYLSLPPPPNPQIVNTWLWHRGTDREEWSIHSIFMPTCCRFYLTLPVGCRGIDRDVEFNFKADWMVFWCGCKLRLLIPWCKRSVRMSENMLLWGEYLDMDVWNTVTYCCNSTMKILTLYGHHPVLLWWIN